MYVGNNYRHAPIDRGTIFPDPAAITTHLHDKSELNPLKGHISLEYVI